MTEMVAIEALRTIRSLANSKRQDNSVLHQLTEQLFTHIMGDEMVKVRLLSFNDKKIQTIKTVREWTGLGLKESKELVERAPVAFDFSLSPAKAYEFVNDLRASGASAEVVL